MWYLLILDSESVTALPQAVSAKQAKTMAIDACAGEFKDSDDPEELQIMVYNTDMQIAEFCKVVRTVTYTCE